VLKLDRQVLGVAGGAAVAHGEDAPARAHAPRQRLGAGGDARRVRLEEAQLGVGAFARLFEDRVDHEATFCAARRPYWK
jgi:hypothetical protein